MPHFLVDNGQINLHYKLFGSGKIRVLFIHGLATPMGDWKRQIDYFTKKPDYQVALLDNRGVGMSTAPVGFYSAARMALDALELLDHCLKWDTFHLVGLSMGGMIALELSLQTLHRLRSLTLMVTHAGGLTSIAPVRCFSVPPNLVDGRVVTEYVDFVMPLLYSKKWRLQTYIDDNGIKTNITNEDAIKKEMIALRAKNPAKFAGFIGQLGAVLTHYVSTARLQDLKNSKVPVMIMTGTKDRLVRPINSTLLRDILNPEEFIVFEGAGHMIHQECHAEVNAALHRHFCLHDDRLLSGSSTNTTEATRTVENTQSIVTAQKTSGQLFGQKTLHPSKL